MKPGTGEVPRWKEQCERRGGPRTKLLKIADTADGKEEEEKPVVEKRGARERKPGVWDLAAKEKSV